MTIETSEIIEFIKEISGRKDIKPDADIFDEVGIYGDDFHEMIEKFATKYSVDMSGYLWYFHTNEEGHSFGSLFFDPPYKKVKRIPISPRILSEFATKGLWDINYPAHNIPKKRYDLIINMIFVGLFFLTILIWIVFKFLK
jgi:hypothetical protein